MLRALSHCAHTYNHTLLTLSFSLCKIFLMLKHGRSIGTTLLTVHIMYIFSLASQTLPNYYTGKGLVLFCWAVHSCCKWLLSYNLYTPHYVCSSTHISMSIVVEIINTKLSVLNLGSQSCKLAHKIDEWCPLFTQESNNQKATNQSTPTKSDFVGIRTWDVLFYGEKYQTLSSVVISVDRPERQVLLSGLPLMNAVQLFYFSSSSGKCADRMSCNPAAFPITARST